MANCYNLDGIKKDIEKEIDRYQCMKKEWESVKFPTKKNKDNWKLPIMLIILLKKRIKTQWKY